MSGADRGDDVRAGMGQRWQQAGQHRVRHAAAFDEEIAPHNELFRAAAAVGPGDHVLDIGCGAGQSTREAARAAVSGSALGVDLSAEALALARRSAPRMDCATSASSRPTRRSAGSRRSDSTWASAGSG